MLKFERINKLYSMKNKLLFYSSDHKFQQFYYLHRRRAGLGARSGDRIQQCTLILPHSSTHLMQSGNVYAVGSISLSASIQFGALTLKQGQQHLTEG